MAPRVCVEFKWLPLIMLNVGLVRECILVPDFDPTVLGGAVVTLEPEVRWRLGGGGTLQRRSILSNK